MDLVGLKLPDLREVRGAITLRVALCIVAMYPFVSSSLGFAQDAASFYKRNCAACHSIGGGRLLGPDLKGVESRKDRKWLTQFLQDPKVTLAAGDPYGKQILAEAKGMVMPKVNGVDEAMAGALLDYIAGGGKTAAYVAEPPLTAVDAAKGQALITGRERLTNGGTPCAACHAFAGLEGAAGGGELGPDLTNEFTRLGGRKGLTMWLSAPPTPTMQAIYSKHPLKAEEITAIAAWLRNQPKNKHAVRAHLWLATLGPCGCVAALLLMGAFWSKRFRAVRAPLTRAGYGRVR